MITPNILNPKNELIGGFPEFELALEALNCKIKYHEKRLPYVLKELCETIPGWEWDYSEDEMVYMKKQEQTKHKLI